MSCRFCFCAMLAVIIGGCGVFHPKPYAMFTDDPAFKSDAAATVNISPVAENEYTVIGGWSEIGISRDGGNTKHYPEDSWVVLLAPGEYVFFVRSPNRVLRVKQNGLTITKPVFDEISATVKSRKKYRLVRATVEGRLTYELREMEYLGDIWKLPPK